MKRLLPLLLIPMLAAACGQQPTTSSDKKPDTDTPSAAQPPIITQLAVKPVDGYFVKNNIKVTDSLTFWIVDNQKSFDSLFATAKTLGTAITAPDFGTELIIAVSMPVTSYGTTIQLQKAELNDQNNTADLHFIATAGAKNTYTIAPLWIGSVAKSGLQTLHFFNGDHLSRSSDITQ